MSEKSVSVSEKEAATSAIVNKSIGTGSGTSESIETTSVELLRTFIWMVGKNEAPKPGQEKGWVEYYGEMLVDSIRKPRANAQVAPGFESGADTVTSTVLKSLNPVPLGLNTFVIKKTKVDFNTYYKILDVVDERTNLMELLKKNGVSL